MYFTKPEERKNIFCDKNFLPDKNKINIVMFGNSITARGNWNALLNRTDVINSGVAGYTTSHFVWIIKESVIDYSPKICFIEGGINDLGVGIPISRTYHNIQVIVNTLKFYKIIPVLQSTIYTQNDSIMNLRVDSLNNLIKDYAMQNGIDYIDLNASLSQNKRLRKEYSADGIHLTGYAYKPWGTEVSKILKKYKI